MTSNNHQEESLKKALKQQDKKIKEAYVNDSWMFDETITNKSLMQEYKALDIKKEKFNDNLELLDFPEENSKGWRLALDMTEEDS